MMELSLLFAVVSNYLGRYYVNASGERLNGISAIDVCTNGQFPNRLIGDVEIFNEEFGETYLGYEIILVEHT